MTSTTAVPQQTSIGGVRAFFAPVDGPVQAALTFRVGWADETLAAHGVSHLVEHLVLAPLGPPTFSWNGTTEAERTTFYCEGTADQVAWFLDSVTANIRALPLQHLDVERRLMGTEACHRVSGLAGLHDMWRWGAQGHGLGGFDEFGLAHLGEHQIRDWAARFLTAENSCLWITGTPPAALVLPHGEPEAAPAPPAWRATPMPSFFATDVGKVSFSGELREGQWAGLVAWLLEQRLMSRLRYTDGLTYGVQSAVVSVGRDLRRLVVSVDGLPDRLSEVATGAADVVQILAEQGPSTEELDSFAALVRGAMQGRDQVVHDLIRHADDALSGRQTQSRDELLAELSALTGEQVRGFAAALLPTMLWFVPSGVDLPGVAAAQESSSERVSGQRFRALRRLSWKRYVDVSDLGMTLCSPSPGAEAFTTILWAQCTAVLAFDDGTRVLFGRDAMQIVLYPERWRRYAELCSYIDRHIPSGSLAPQGEAPFREPPRKQQPDWELSFEGKLVLWAWTIGFIACSVAFMDGFQPAMLVIGLVTAALGVFPLSRIWRRRRL